MSFSNILGGAWDFATSDAGLDILGTLGGAVAGGVLANGSDRGSITPFQTGVSQSGGGSTSTTSSYSGAPTYLLPFLQGDQGVYQQAQNLYNQNMEQGYQGGMSPRQWAVHQEMMNALGGEGWENFLNQQQVGEQLGSQYATDPTGVNLSQARQGQGALDPSGALQQILSGQINTQGLDQLQAAANNRAMVGYGDAVSDAGRMFREQIAPNIRNEAILAGQYGGTRQDIAEGIAAGRLQEQLARNARDLTLSNQDIGAKLYGDAYSKAQDQQFGAAAGLNTQALQNAQFGQNFGLGANLQNAGLAQQGLNIDQQALDNFLAGRNTAYNLAQRPIDDRMNAQQFGWNQLNQYLNALHGAMPESTSSSTSSSSQGSTSQSWSPVVGEGMSVLEGLGYGGAIGQNLASLFK